MGQNGGKRFLDLHRPDALRILDFPHAAEYVGQLLQALPQAGVTLPARALERSLHVLKHRGPGLLLRWCERLPAAITEREEVQKPLHSVRKREALMQYPFYQRQGWPIGSGMVQSANKAVVQSRLNGAGMHWAAEQVHPMEPCGRRSGVNALDEAWREGGQRATRSPCHAASTASSCSFPAAFFFFHALTASIPSSLSQTSSGSHSCCSLAPSC